MQLKLPMQPPILPAQCNGGQAMTARGWLQGALGAMDAGYGRRGKAVGKAVGKGREVIP